MEEQLNVFFNNFSNDKLITILTKSNKKLIVEYNISSVTDNQYMVYGFVITFCHSEQNCEKNNINNELLN